MTGCAVATGAVVRAANADMERSAFWENANRPRVHQTAIRQKNVRPHAPATPSVKMAFALKNRVFAIPNAPATPSVKMAFAYLWMIAILNARMGQHA